MTNREYKSTALEMLSGRWPIALLIFFVGSLLGSSLIVDTITADALLTLYTVFPFLDNFLQTFAPWVGYVIFLMFSLSQMLFTAQLMMGGLVDLGQARFTLNLYDGHPVRFFTLFCQIRNLVPACLLFYFRKFLVLIKTFLLIVPGVIAHYDYSMAHFILCDQPDITAREALRQSKELMKGHKMDLFRLDMSFIAWILLSVATLGFGFIILRPYMLSAHVAFYRELSERPANR